MRKFVALSLIFSAIFAFPLVAWASGWRFCVASDFIHHRLFITPLFAMDQERSALEQHFGMALAAQDIIAANVQCPMPLDSKADALTTRQNAIVFGQTMHFAVSLAPLPSGALIARDPAAQEISFKP